MYLPEQDSPEGDRQPTGQSLHQGPHALPTLILDLPLDPLHEDIQQKGHDLKQLLEKFLQSSGKSTQGVDRTFIGW